MNDQPPIKPWQDTLRRPTFWVVALMLLGFIYMQWPTRDRTPPPIDYQRLEHPAGVLLSWEDEPRHYTEAGIDAWHLSRARMEFLVQRGPLHQPVEAFAEHAIEVDRSRVSGAISEPLNWDNGQARYTLIDVEGRIQQHRLFERDDHWIKVSILYRSQNDQHRSRAAYFLNSLSIQPQEEGDD